MYHGFCFQIWGAGHKWHTVAVAQSMADKQLGSKRQLLDASMCFLLLPLLLLRAAITSQPKNITPVCSHAGALIRSGVWFSTWYPDLRNLPCFSVYCGSLYGFPSDERKLGYVWTYFMHFHPLEFFCLWDGTTASLKSSKCASAVLLHCLPRQK